jgi:hypothetical protein
MKVEFSKHSRGQCLECINAYQRNYKKGKGRETQKRYQTGEAFKKYQKEYHQRPKAKIWFRNHYLKTNYGITHMQYEQMLFNQGGACAICKETMGTKKLHVDHCHSTGIVRGILCAPCNHALGSFRDKIENLSSAIVYLKKATRSKGVKEKGANVMGSR